MGRKMPQRIYFVVVKGCLLLLRTSWALVILGARVALCFYKIITCATCLHVCLLIEPLNNQFPDCRKHCSFMWFYDSLAQKISQNICSCRSITVPILFHRNEVSSKISRCKIIEFELCGKKDYFCLSFKYMF